MSLKAMHEANRQSLPEQKQSNEQENSLQRLVEEQAQVIAELQSQVKEDEQTIQTHLSEISMLKSELQKLAEKNEKLNESDNVLKQNEELKRRNKELLSREQNVKQEAETKVGNARAYANVLEQQLKEKLKKAEEREERAQTLINKQAQVIMTEARKMTEAERNENELEYMKKTRAIKRKYDRKENQYFFMLIISAIGAWFHAIGTEHFISDFEGFFGGIWAFIKGLWKFATNGANTASQIAYNIPQEAVAFIVHFLICAIVFLLLFGAVLALIGYGLYRLGVFYHKEFWDMPSLWVVSISLLVVAYFGDFIRNAIPINLFLLIILVHGIYLIIRMATTTRKPSYYW